MCVTLLDRLQGDQVCGGVHLGGEGGSEKGSPFGKGGIGGWVGGLWCSQNVWRVHLGGEGGDEKGSPFGKGG